jgi:hypothetical protein
MQNKRNPKLRHRSKFSQLLLLDEQANVISSCDSIFSAHQFSENHLVKSFPFLESILPSLRKLPVGSDVHFSKIQTPLDVLPGIYDFSFHKIQIEDYGHILWGIYDYSDLYEDYKQFQQRKNELEMHRELLERRHRNLRNKEELGLQQNIILEHLDHIQLTYFNRIKTALLAPINPLDGLVFLIGSKVNRSKKKYLPQLKNTLDQLQMIIREFPVHQDVNSANENDYYSLVQTFADLKHFLSLKLGCSVQLEVTIAANIPEKIKGDSQDLLQILFGMLLNSYSLHPTAVLSINVELTQITNTLSAKNLRITLTEQLNNRPNLLSAEDYQDLLCRLSIVRQLIEAHGGNIQVAKDPKNLSIAIAFDYHL